MLSLVPRLSPSSLPAIGGIRLADSSILVADGQLAVSLSDKGAKELSRESAAIDFLREAFGHLKAIAVDKDVEALLECANIRHEDKVGVVAASDSDAFVAAVKIR
jgi:catalase